MSSHYDVKQEVTDKYSLRGRVFHKLREDILSGKYEENEELKEVAIGEELGVSRTPVREAFRQLELEGLIQIIPNKGAYVTGITEKDVKDIYMIRSLLEGLCAMQTKIALGGVSEEELKRIIIAYEPVWAIGTGKTATAEQANEVCAAIRQTIKAVYSEAAGDGITIQYGGSMNAGNAAELLSQPDVDGGLIGGASLKPQDFATIVEAATKG